MAVAWNEIGDRACQQAASISMASRNMNNRVA